jgi:hypothetical protein
MKVKLLKNMTVNGVNHSAGEILDATGWRTTKSLISMRYLSLVEEDKKPVTVVKEVKSATEVAEENPEKAKSSVKK